MLKGILFDMDGVIFDTERQYAVAETRAVADMGYTLSQEVKLSMCGCTNDGCRAIMRDAMGPAFDFDEYWRRTDALMDEIRSREGLVKKPCVQHTLAWLVENGYKVALASSTPHHMVVQHLAEGGLTPYFSAVIGGDMVANSKPAPDIFLAAAKALGLPAGQCAAVEDSAKGVQSAQSAGCHTVMVPDLQPATDRLRRLAHTVLPTLCELPAYLSGLN